MADQQYSCFSNWLLPFVILFSMVSHVQAQFTEDQILSRLEALQSENDDFYDNGLLPSKRSWGIFSKPVEDNTIFFSASAAVVLLEVQQRQLLADSLRVQKILDGLTANYEKYRSRNGKPSYNFWQTVPPDLPFPNGTRWLSNEKMRLPDDFDTSVLVALSVQGMGALVDELRAYLIDYAGRERRREVELITKEEYEEFQAYEVWFGKDMPQTFDICVMSNVLLFVLKNRFELTTYDSATIDLVNQMVLNEDHLKESEKISHYTSSPAVILYHLARLLAYDQIGYFKTIRPRVISDLNYLLRSVDNEFERILLSSSLLRLGVMPPFEIDQQKLLAELPEYSLFAVRPLAISGGASGISGLLPTMTWRSEAFNWTLVLEYLALKKSRTD